MVFPKIAILVVFSAAIALLAGCDCTKGDSSCDASAETYRSCVLTADGTACRTPQGINGVKTHKRH